MIAILTGEPHPLAESRDVRLLDTATVGGQVPRVAAGQAVLRAAFLGAGVA